ncbi:hypothetical protein DLM76_21105 [Leptospira yasudae]|uniref:DUF4365 domain-containing protein n=1 Tax=Leptospira yasudae TaxID=2202201 RepID=UPI000E599CA6|nr:DUF4365 domain-containing protein [Leptospira yasudae]RHX89518.1 hypothetical protein DLM76_21105 [Leptospira yasudae]
MAFNDNPSIDIYSKASEQSVLCARSFFSQKNNFIAREETPDFGVDLDVELMINSKASGFKFAIQIKSFQEIETIEIHETVYVKYSIATSRLGYLTRRKPGFGMILLFDDKTNLLYYDYIENIYEIVMNRHKDESWKNQNDVTFYIPVTNQLNSSEINLVYSKMKRRFENTDEMYSQTSRNFGIPQFEAREKLSIEGILEKFGYIFYNKGDYSFLVGKLKELSLSSITGSPTLVLLAALVYSETGSLHDALFFYNKAEKYRNQYTESELDALNISKISIEYFKGDISSSDYLLKLKEIKGTASNAQNQMLIEVKIISCEYSEDLDYNKEDRYIARLFDVVDKYLKDKEDLSDGEVNNLLEVASIAHEISIHHYLKNLTEYKIKSKLQAEVVLPERTSHALKMIDFFIIPQLIVNKLLDLDIVKGNEILKANAYSKLSYFFYTRMMQSINMHYSEPAMLSVLKSSQAENLYLYHFKLAIIAFNTYNASNYLQHAYESLSSALEINESYVYLFNKEISKDHVERIRTIMSKLESVLDKVSYEPISLKALQEIKAIPNKTILEISEEEKNNFADHMINSLALPEERKRNIINEIETLKYLKENVDEKYFDILTNLEHTKQLKTLYSEPSRFIIICKSCRYETKESSNKDALLNQLKEQHSHVCL